VPFHTLSTGSALTRDLSMIVLIGAPVVMGLWKLRKFAIYS
jgi:hypothetical protein